MNRRYAVPALLLAACTAVTGCGGASATSSPPAASRTSASTSAAPVKVTAANKALTAGAAKLAAAGSAKVDGTIVTKPTGVGAALTLHFAGKERWSPSQAADLTLTGVHVAGTAVGTARMLVTDQAIYVKLPMLSSLLHKPWAKISFKDSTSIGGVDLGQFAGQAQQLQPVQYLSMLASSANVKPVGKPVTIDGVSTRHYTGTVDLQKALAALPHVSEVWSKLATSEGLKAVHLDAWLDSANRPRKLTMTLSSAALSLTVNLHLSSYGVKVVLTTPPSGQTLDLTKGLLGSLG
ncbi:MAG: hypothetical protein QOJ11_2010 [Frankiales bacterium]|jgi:hypothetical protein|nr:hypothetical protein [Frankiales bacterium]